MSFFRHEYRSFKLSIICSRIQDQFYCAKIRAIAVLLTSLALATVLEQWGFHFGWINNKIIKMRLQQLPKSMRSKLTSGRLQKHHNRQTSDASESSSKNIRFFEKKHQKVLNLQNWAFAANFWTKTSTELILSWRSFFFFWTSRLFQPLLPEELTEDLFFIFWSSSLFQPLFSEELSEDLFYIFFEIWNRVDLAFWNLFS